jgi:hypothetical protein
MGGGSGRLSKDAVTDYEMIRLQLEAWKNQGLQWNL